MIPSGRSRILAVLVAVGTLLALVGWWRGDLVEVAAGMTYGNFDGPNDASFVGSHMAAGLGQDWAQRRVYRFDEGVSWEGAPLLILGLVFLVFLALQLGSRVARRFELRRLLTQWLAFAVTRLGVLRVADVCPLRRSTLGVIPVLNCQGCEMAVGACPVGAMQHFLASQRLPMFVLGSMVVFGAALGRWACGWLCPFGMLSDLADRLSFRLWRPPHAWRGVKFVVLGLIVVVSVVVGLLWTAPPLPYCATICPSGTVLGHLPYYVTWAWSEASQAVVSPIERTVGFLCIWWHGILTLAVFALMLVAGGRVFCSLLCPLGAFLGLFNGVAAVRVAHDGARCTRCDRCLSVCPMGIDLAAGDFLTVSDCVACGRCVKVCGRGGRLWDLPLQVPQPASESSLSSSSSSSPSLSSPRPVPPGDDEAYIPLRGRVARLLLPLATLTPQGMARYARDHTRFYARLYEGHSPDDFASLPILRKRQVRECSPYDLLSDEFRDRASWYGETTGSSGSPTPSFLTAREFAGAATMSTMTPYAGLMAKLLQRNRTCLNGLAFGFTIAGQSFGDIMAKAGGLVATTGSRSTLATPPRIADAISRLEPGLIAATPIDFLSWMRIVDEDFPRQAPRVRERLLGLMSTAELCAPSRVRAIERHFGIRQVDNYACVEGFFTMACPCGGKHILPLYLVELFDEDLHPLTGPGRGRLAFTGLAKRSSPLVRYLLDDDVTVGPARCPWGFTTNVIPHGRWELGVRVGGRQLNVGDFEDQIFDEGLFGDYRVRILADDRAVVVLEDYAAPAGAPARVAERLERVFGLVTEASLVPFGTLTAYRDVRVVKPILKLEDLRPSSRQEVPEFL